jgi:hypothetical protein
MASLVFVLIFLQTDRNPVQETSDFLDVMPDRLGHATFLNEEARQRLIAGNIGVELCLTSNILFVLFPFKRRHHFNIPAIRCDTVKTLKDHHITWYLEQKHPIAICVGVCDSESKTESNILSYRRTTFSHSGPASPRSMLCFWRKLLLGLVLMKRKYGELQQVAWIYRFVQTCNC